MWTVKVLKRHERVVFKLPPIITWEPVDPEMPAYDNYHNAMGVYNDYRAQYPNARIQIQRHRDAAE